MTVSLREEGAGAPPQSLAEESGTPRPSATSLHRLSARACDALVLVWLTDVRLNDRFYVRRD